MKTVLASLLTEVRDFVTSVADMEEPKAQPKQASAATPSKEVVAAATSLVNGMISRKLVTASRKDEVIGEMCDPLKAIDYVKRACDLMHKKDQELVEHQKKASASADAPSFSTGAPRQSYDRGLVQKTSAQRLAEADEAFAQAVQARRA